MARMHSRAKGKSGSTRPIAKVPSWAPYKGKEVEKLVIKYAKSGNTTSEIGMILRDSYGIPNVKTFTDKKITEILSEQNLTKELPEDILSLIRKLNEIKQHLEKNKQDKTAVRGFQLTNSKLRRLVKYYKENNKLSPEFSLDLNRLKMYLE